MAATALTPPPVCWSCGRRDLMGVNSNLLGLPPIFVGSGGSTDIYILRGRVGGGNYAARWDSTTLGRPGRSVLTDPWTSPGSASTSESAAGVETDDRDGREAFVRAPALLRDCVSLWPHAHPNDRAIVTLTLDWDRATFHPIDGRTQRLEVPLPQELGEDARNSLASALVGLEVVGGPIENAKLSRSHIRMEITRDADLEAIKQRLQALVDDVLPPTDEASN